MTRILDLTGQELDASVSTGDATWVIDFHTPGCQSCAALDGVLRELAAELSDVRFGRVNVAEEQALAERYAVRSAPTTIVYRGGQEVRRLFGSKTRRQLLKVLDNAREQATWPTSRS